MGNIGTAISQPIPAVGTIGTTYAVQIDAFLTEVKARLEAKVPFSALVGSSTLDFNNQALINAHHVALTDVGSTPTSANTAASALAAYGGDLYWVTGAGACKITLGTTLNASSLGGIGGDYAAPAALNYVLANQEYDFYVNSGTPTWAWLKNYGERFVSHANPGFYASVYFNGVASYTYKLPDAPPAAFATVVTMDSSGNLLVDSNVNASINLGVGADLKHADQWEIIVPITSTAGTNSTGFWGTSGDHTTYISADGAVSRTLRLWIPGLRVGDIIQKATFRWMRNAGTSTFDVCKVVDGVETSLLAAPVTVNTGTTQTTPAALSVPHTVASDTQYFVKWAPPSSSSLDRLYSVSVFVTH